MFGAKLTQVGRPPSYHRQKCHPKPYRQAMKDFADFFMLKTGIEWANRLHGVPDPEKEKKDLWKYCVPTLGRPVGYPPPAEKPTGKSSEEEEGEDDGSDDSGVGLIHDTDSEVNDP